MSEKLTPKDYLMQIRKLRVLIDQREKELDRLREQTFSSASGIDYSRIPVKGSRRVGASFEQAANKALDLTGEVAGLIDEYNDLRHKIIGEIQSLDRPEYMQVLYKRYVEEKHWEEISVEMGYSCDHIRHLHGWALHEFGKLMKEMKDNTQ